MVLNHTYTCFFAQQEIPISLMANGWLHKGSLVCPACRDVCGAEFEARGGKGCDSKEFRSTCRFEKIYIFALANVKCSATSILTIKR